MCLIVMMINILSNILTETTERLLYQLKGNRDVSNYIRLLKSSANEASLAVFLSTCEKGQGILSVNTSIVLAGGFADGEIMKIVHGGVSCLEELESTRRRLTHSTVLSRDHSRIIVRCDDTDVLVLLLHYSSKGILANEVYVRAGYSDKKKHYILIHQIFSKLSGCDTTRGLHRLGKRTAYSALAKNADVLQGLTKSVDKDTFLKSPPTFVLLLHGEKAKHVSSLNEQCFIHAATTDKLRHCCHQMRMLLNCMPSVHFIRLLFGARDIFQGGIDRPNWPCVGIS